MGNIKESPLLVRFLVGKNQVENIESEVMFGAIFAFGIITENPVIALAGFAGMGLSHWEAGKSNARQLVKRNEDLQRRSRLRVVPDYET